jgi:hypothetical protein
MRKRFLALALVAVAGCGQSAPPTGFACNEIAAAGLGVSLTDSVTGVSTGFANVLIVARAATYADTVFLAEYTDTVPLAYEHRGTVQVTVRADGYALWLKNGITISGDVCHVHEEFVSARLVR